MTRPALVISVSPAESFLCDPISIRASNFVPGEKVRLQSRLVDDTGLEWMAWGQFVADADGVIDVANAPSEDGTFTGLDPAGLFWSMQPAGGRSFQTQSNESRHMMGTPVYDPLRPQKIEISATGELGTTGCAFTLNRLIGDIETFEVRDGRVRGMAFRWKDRSRKRGAIMTLTGSGGGIEMGYAPVLASLGYDVLGLAYFAYDNLPQYLASIPLEYFEESFQWMQREFGCEKIAVQGASRGGELTLVLASYLPEYVSGCTPIVPMYASVNGWNHDTNEMGPSWTFRGKDIPFVAWEKEPMSMEEMRRLGQQDPLGLAMTSMFRAALDDEQARETATLPVELANGPILLISGVQDAMWPCTWGADLVVDRLRAHGYRHPYRHLALRETGHLTPLPNSVTAFSEALYHPLARVLLTCGGNPQGAARASWVMWDAMRAHYREIFGH